MKPSHPGSQDRLLSTCEHTALPVTCSGICTHTRTRTWGTLSGCGFSVCDDVCSTDPLTRRASLSPPPMCVSLSLHSTPSIITASVCLCTTWILLFRAHPSLGPPAKLKCALFLLIVVSNGLVWVGVGVGKWSFWYCPYVWFCG